MPIGPSRQNVIDRRDPAADRDGGRARRRSGDLPLFRRSLCQLSYPTMYRCEFELYELSYADLLLRGPDEI